jgi:signal peptidase I
MKAVSMARRCAGFLAVALLFGSGLVLTALGIGPRTGAYRTLTVLTGSMNPAIPAGSMVLVTPEPSSEVRVGQIITYSIPTEDHRVVSHRVVEVLERSPSLVIRTKGDANETPDPWLARVEDPTVWQVRTVIPGLGTAIRWLRSPVVHRVTVFMVPAFLAMLWLADIWRPRRDLDGAIHA